MTAGVSRWTLRRNRFSPGRIPRMRCDPVDAKAPAHGCVSDLRLQHAPHLPEIVRRIRRRDRAVGAGGLGARHSASPTPPPQSRTASTCITTCSRRSCRSAGRRTTSAPRRSRCAGRSTRRSTQMNKGGVATVDPVAGQRRPQPPEAERGREPHDDAHGQRLCRQGAQRPSRPVRPVRLCADARHRRHAEGDRLRARRAQGRRHRAEHELRQPVPGRSGLQAGHGRAAAPARHRLRASGPARTAATRSRRRCRARSPNIRRTPTAR